MMGFAEVLNPSYALVSHRRRKAYVVFRPGNCFQICLDGQISKSVSSPFAKNILPSLPTQITCINLAVSSHQRGGSRSSRTRDGMRWTRAMSEDE
jgi:hypothetical protein